MPQLGVNIDHIATLRQARYRDWKRGLPPEPELLPAALEAERAGARGITVHLREDRRHIQDADVQLLRRSIKTRLNLEMAVTGEMVKHALRHRPDEVCLVPENRKEVTTEGGLNVAADAARMAQAVQKLRERKIIVSVFIDPDEEQVRAAGQVGAQAIELHTGSYANATTVRERDRELRRHEKAFELGAALGLQVNAGHGLHYSNLALFLERLPRVHTLNIGHAIVARAISVGWSRAVREMVAIIRKVK